MLDVGGGGALALAWAELNQVYNTTIGPILQRVCALAAGVRYSLKLPTMRHEGGGRYKIGLVFHWCPNGLASHNFI